jgi:hypothetical protein
MRRRRRSASTWCPYVKVPDILAAYNHSRAGPLSSPPCLSGENVDCGGRNANLVVILDDSRA